MTPILFDTTETAFTSNGIGRLSDAISCIVTEERNGTYELKMVYPVNGSRYYDLAHSRIIYAQPAEQKGPQAFRIYKISRPMNGKVTVLAQHISYQLTSIPVSPFAAETAEDAVAGLVSNAAVTCPFTISTDIDMTADFELTEPESIRSAIGGIDDSILNTYGGELEWDMYSVILHGSRGEDRGKIISYGRNATDMKHEQSIDKVVTGIYPFYRTDDDYVELTEKVLTVSTSESYPYQRIEKLDLTKYFADVPTETELRTKAEEYLSKTTLGVPKLTIKASFIDEDEHHTPVWLCDTVAIYHTLLGISLKAKVVKLEYNTLLERYETITVGSTADSVTDAVLTVNKATKSTEKAVTEVAASTKEQIAEVQQEIAEAGGDFIEPQMTNTHPIEDGETAVVMLASFSLTVAAYVHIGAMLEITTTATTTGSTTNLSIVCKADSTTVITMAQDCEDGCHILTVDCLSSQLAIGTHTVTIEITATGGAAE